MVRRILLSLLLSFSCHLLPGAAYAAPSHCLTYYGECKYPAGFAHFDYVNPDAPKGGGVKLAETGSFDNLNPFILNGVKAPAIAAMLFESLMAASQDEPQTLYGLVAQSVEVAKDGGSVEFVLRNEARFHDGSKITPDDVVFSFATLKEKGDPTYKILYAAIASAEKTGEHTVRFTFTDGKNRELPLIAASMPILSKVYYDKVDFSKTTLEAPVGSGPYKVESVEQGRQITYRRDPDYWGKDLPVNRGQYNFATFRYDLYRDENVAMQGLFAGEYDFRREYIARNWATAYDVPAVRDGRIVKRNIPDETPQGMQAFIFNTRKPQFADRRVREAIDLALDYEWVNKTIFYGAYERNHSYFQNTEFEAKGLPQGKELALLKPLADELPPALFTQPFKNPTTDGSGNARDNLLKAQKLLEEAGWQVKDGKRVDAKGAPLNIEFMLRQPTMERVIGPMRKNLERLGIASSIRMVDDSQYQKRLDDKDFDIVSIWINRGNFFPGNEQVALWHSAQAEVKGGNNLGGTQSKAVDALLGALVNAKDYDDYRAAGRALDRVLLWEHYVIPNWNSGSYRVAYWDKFGLPKIQAKYNLAFQAWWVKPR
jgi:microcin C transport system substrate-binding protein